MYKIELKRNEKIFMVTMSGFVSKDEGNNFISELSNQLTKFNNSEYIIVIDTQNLNASAQECVNQIKEGIDIIVKAPFKKHYNIASKNLITNMQAQRVGKDVNFNKITVMKSYEEVLQAIA